MGVNVEEIRQTTGLTLEEVRAHRAESAETRQLLETFLQSESAARAEAAGAHEAIVALARRISDRVEDFDQAMLQLDWAVGEVVKAREDAERGSNLGELVDQVLARLAELTSAGKFDEASALADNEFARWERDEAERREAALETGYTLLDAGVRQDLLRLDAAAAAAKLARRVELQTPDPAARFDALRAVWVEWYERGRDKGLNLDLEVSIELAGIDRNCAECADQRGEVFNDLGISLWTLGQRESNSARLFAAVEAHRAGLSPHSPDEAQF